MSMPSERTQSLFKKAERDLLRLSANQQAENVHRFRTTIRRLQTVLEEFVPERDRNQKKLLKLLNRVRRRAGKVRDLDVQLAALRSLKIAQQPRRKTQLMQALIDLRAKHERKLCKLLAEKDVRGIGKRLKWASKDLKMEATPDPLAIARKMIEQVPRPTGQVSEAVLHRYRTAVKRARYAAEFAPKSAEVTKFLSEMKRLQDAIGGWHDWLTLTQAAASRLGALNESSLVAALHNVTGGKFRQAVAALSKSSVIGDMPKLVSSLSERARKLAVSTPASLVGTESAA